MEPFLGEIRMFAGRYAPRDWALCDGRLLSIDEHDALFSLLGTTFGGDGKSTFGVPDLRGRAPVHVSPDYALGQMGGLEQVELTPAHFPAHTHEFNAMPTQGTTARAEGGYLAGRVEAMYVSSAPNTDMHDSMIGESIGTSGEPYGRPAPEPHNNMQPFLVINFIIALSGVYPQGY